jgi:hypothetical protein
LITGVTPFAVRGNYQSTLDIYTTEIQQIWQQLNHNTVLGARFQTGDFHTRNLQQIRHPNSSMFFTIPSATCPRRPQHICR